MNANCPTRGSRRRRNRGEVLSCAIESLEARWLLAVDVLAYHNDNQSTGLNSNETQLTAGNVNVSNFGKRYATTLDGQAYTQPLYVAALNITSGPNAGVHNTVFVATQHDSLYAIDADSGVILYKIAFLNLANALPNATSITPMPQADTGSSDITPEIGITATPAIDKANGFLYLTAKTKEIVNNDTTNPHYVYRLHKVNIATGTFTSTIIGDTIRNTGTGAYTNNTGIYVRGTGDGTAVIGGQSRVYFNAMRQMNRPGLVLYNGEIYTAWASHGDNGPYHGWLIAFNANTLAVTRALNTTPNGGLGGIWQGGGITAIDPQGFFYFETGNGTFNTNAANFNAQGFPIDGAYGDCFVKVALDPTSTINSQNINGWGLKVVDFFSPFNNAALNSVDRDLGSGGPLILPDSAGSATYPRLLVGAGKESKVYLIDRDNMGKFDPATDHVVQQQGGAIGTSGSFGTPAYYNGHFIYGGVSTNVRSFAVSNASFVQTSQSPDTIGALDGTISVSSNGLTNGLAWVIDRGTNSLKAYDANNLATQVWTSLQAPLNRDQLGTVVKFTVPTIADGRVFVGTNNALVAYGPPQPPTSAPATPTALAATPASGIQIDLTWQDNATNEDGYEVYLSTNNSTFNKIATISVNSQSYSAVNLTVGTQYWFKVRAFNAFNGTSYSNYSNTATATTNNQVPNLNFANGFATSAGQLNYIGSAKIVGSNANLTDGTIGQTGTIWSKIQQDIRKFNVNFSFQITNPNADGFTFTIQRAGNAVIGGGGGNLGYQGILTSLAVKFDIYQNVSETGVYQNGAAPTGTGAYSTLPNVDLHSGRVMNVSLSYDGTNLSQTITDSVTNGVYSHIYGGINIPSIIGGNNAFVGFTGATGGEVAIQDIRSWTFITVPSEAPVAPSNLIATAASGTQFNLTWTDNASTEDGFKIFRKTGLGGTYAQVGTVGVNVTAFMDTALNPNVDYYYKVVANNVAGDSAPSNEVLAHTPVPPITPSNGRATSVTTTQIAMAWTDNANDEDGFKILRETNGSQFIEIATLGPNSTSYIDNGPGGLGLTPGTEYDYHIQEFNIAGYSDFTGFTIATRTLAPSNVQASATFGQIAVTWTAPANTLDPGQLTYSVYRATTPGGQGASPIAVGLLSPSYTDYAVSNGATYYYKITATDSGGESAASGESSALATTTITGTNNADAYYIRRDATGAFVEFFAATNPNGTALYKLPYASLGSFAIDTLDGDDTLYVDLANGSPVPAGGFTLAGGIGADAIRVIGDATAQTITFNASTISLAGSAPISFTGTESAVFDGKNGWDNVTINGGPTVTFPATQHLQSLTLNNGTNATVTAGTLVTRTLSLAPSTTLDLNNNNLIVDYTGTSQLAAVQSLITSARAGGAWTGSGITSVTARNAKPKNTTLAAMESSDFQSLYGPAALFAGESTDATMVLVKYTYYGDTDFSGVVDFDDYSRTDAGYNTNKSGWLNGDFDGNGIVDFDDYSLIDLAFNTQGAALRPSRTPSLPKPSKLVR